jgi:hypothetical protein
MAIIKRIPKGSPLSAAEMDANLDILSTVSSSVNTAFTNIDKLNVSASSLNTTLTTVSSSVANLSSLSGQLSGQFTGSVLVSGSLKFDNILTNSLPNEFLVYDSGSKTIGKATITLTTGATGASGSSGTSGTDGTSGTSGANGDKFATVSTTSNAISTGSKTFTIATGLQWTPGQAIVISENASNKLEGSVTSYNSGTGQLVVNITTATGTGTGITSWYVNTAGAPGQSGSSGTSGVSGSSGSSGTSGVSGSSGTSGSSGSSGTVGTSGTSGLTTSAFPYTGSAHLTGSLNITGSLKLGKTQYGGALYGPTIQFLDLGSDTRAVDEVTSFVWWTDKSGNNKGELETTAGITGVHKLNIKSFEEIKLTDRVTMANSVGITGSLYVSSSISASLRQGYVWVGGPNDRTILVATSSFGGGGTSTIDGIFAKTGSIYATTNNIQITGSLNISGTLTSSLSQGYVWVGGPDNVSKLISTSSLGTALTVTNNTTTVNNVDKMTFTGFSLTDSGNGDVILSTIGGGSSLTVQKGATQVASVSTLDLGSNMTITDNGGGSVTINSAGGGGTSGSSGKSGTNGVDGTNGVGGTGGSGGSSGTSGISGTIGTSGTSGTSGSSGSSGITAASVPGSSGSSGTSGISGTNGLGTDGKDGTSGSSGVGTNGTGGTSGSSGTSGTSGSSGVSGTSGIGSAGSAGKDGTSGTSGISGVGGLDGSSGTSGKDGTSGSSGTSGITGNGASSGTSGISGTSGQDGTLFGSSGTSGISVIGSNGTSGINGSNAVVSQLSVTGSINNGLVRYETSPERLFVSNTLTFDGTQMKLTGSMFVSGAISASAFNIYATGTPEITSATNLNLTAGTTVIVTQSPLRLSNYTDAQTGSLTPSNGDMIYNSTTHKFVGYANGAWVQLH